MISVLPRTLTSQMTALMVAAVLVGAALAAGLLVGLSGTAKMGMTPELKAAAEAARIATIVREARGMPSAGALAAFLAGAQAPGEHITLVARPLFVRMSAAGPDAAYMRRIHAALAADWHLPSLAPCAAGGGPCPIVIALDAQRALAFTASEHQAAQTFIIVQAGMALALIFLLVMALSVYAVHRVTRPLTAFAAAAESFGRRPQAGALLAATGPLEVARVAIALNDMRDRVRRLVDERTRMLAAISHDLRTPLTRLRLRSERVADDNDREGMCDDIDTIDAMLTETLAYLRDGRSDEPAQRIDLPSFLQTLCDAYADTGHAVRYAGPGRFTFRCRPLALRRALSNIIDNGVRFGGRVEVSLNGVAETAARIQITDDGPGIPPELYDKVFEPYFKADPARSGDERGFGLGLAIARDIVERDGGGIALAAADPRGLIVSVALPSL